MEPLRGPVDDEPDELGEGDDVPQLIRVLPVVPQQQFGQVGEQVRPVGVSYSTCTFLFSSINGKLVQYSYENNNTDEHGQKYVLLTYHFVIENVHVGGQESLQRVPDGQDLVGDVGRAILERLLVANVAHA